LCIFFRDREGGSGRPRSSSRTPERRHNRSRSRRSRSSTDSSSDDDTDRKGKGDGRRCVFCVDSDGLDADESLDRHVRRIHSSAAFVCPECEDLFAAYPDYARHINEDHKDNEKCKNLPMPPNLTALKCNLCDRVFHAVSVEQGRNYTNLRVTLCLRYEPLYLTLPSFKSLSVCFCM
jgi:uncharacterized protein YlaI